MASRGLLIVATAASLFTVRAQAASVPEGFSDRQIAAGITSPTALTVLPDGRVLVAQQNGDILLIEGDRLAAESFWKVPNVDSTFERGCLGIVPDPNFSTNHYIYVYCSIISADDSEVSHNKVLRVTEADGKALAGSTQELLSLPPVDAIFHIGGALRFAPDGSLFVAVGNQEDEPQPPETSRSQDLSNPFGKILRIRADGSVPDDNPFRDRSGAYDAIWSYGYRNAFAFDIQPGTGRVFVGDVGQGSWEEINEDVRAGNYGWPYVEGPTSDDRFVSPFFSYKHNSERCAITGAAFYNPPSSQFPDDYVGMFLFEDFCGGTIEMLDPTTAEVRPFVTGIGFPTNLALAPDGSLYYLARNQDTKTHETGVGTLGKIQYTGTVAPRIARHPASQRVLVGEPVSFEVKVDGAHSIQWQRDGADIAGETRERYTLARVSKDDDGAVFRVIAENPLGMTSSDEARLTVTTRKPPIAAISASESSSEYEPGDTLMFVGSGDDDVDGQVSRSGFSWQVDFHHDTHTHPLLGATTGESSLTFKVPPLEAEEANTWIRVWLRVENSDKASGSSSYDVFPARQLSSQSPIADSSPAERDRSAGGKALSIGGIAYLKGWGVRAPSELRYQLAEGCSGKLLTDVGVDDEVGDEGSVVFQVYLDEEKIYDSGLVRGSDARSNVAVEIAGGKRLRFVVEDGGDGSESDHADWAGARVTGCSLTEAGASAPKGDDAAAHSDAGKATAARNEPDAGEGKADAAVAATEPGNTAERADAVMREAAGDGGGCAVLQLSAAGSSGVPGYVLLALVVPARRVLRGRRGKRRGQPGGSNA